MAESVPIYIPFLNESKKLPFRVPTNINSFIFFLVLFILSGLTMLIFVVVLQEPLENLVASILMVTFFFVVLLKLYPSLWIAESGIRYKEYFIFPDRKIDWADFREAKTTAATIGEEFFKRGRKWQGGIIEMEIHHV